MSTMPPSGPSLPSLPPPVVPPNSLPVASDLLITAVVTTQPVAAVDPMIETVPTLAPVIEPTPTLPAPASMTNATPSNVTSLLASGPTGGDDVQVRCPNCDTMWEGSDLRPHAQWFCGSCDFPLFWALPPKADLAGGGGDGDGAFARLPGTDGRETLSSLACPHCGERNPPDPSLDCLRCGRSLTVRHDLVIEPEVITVVQTQVLPPLPARKRRLWPWIVAACVFAAAFVVAVVIILDR